VKLLEPDVRRIDGRAPGERAPVADRAPDELAAGTPEPLRGDLVRLLGREQVLVRALDLIGYASDASPYRLLPKAVVLARETDDVARVFAYGRANGVPVTLRAGGTSLNGQAQGDGILVDVRRHWRGVKVEQGGERVRVRPGTILGHVNRVLAMHGRKLGPDPASTDTATVGGVIANNSGGMRCGVTYDSYQTLRALKFVLPSGTVIDSGHPDAARAFAEREPALARGLEEIRDEIRADAELAGRIRRKFSIKNTTGYRLVAFLDADEPVEIFRRLLVGSEGTLGFVAEAVFETIPARPLTATGMLLFPDIDSAVAVVRPLMELGATAAELMMAASLKVARAFVETPASWDEAPLEAAAILAEFRADDEAELAERVAAGLALLSEQPLLEPPELTRDPAATELFWRVREGMHGLVSRLRPQGTALIMEDVCVDPERIAEAAKDITAVLGKHGFLPGVAGHASAGNLHFMLTPMFSEPQDRERYEAFMHELVDLVVDKYDGSLKAEHGTGFNMAPYVEREWGPKATGLMWRIKELADPDGVLAPGVVLSRDPGIHLRNLKTTPQIEEVADNCIECGLCEPVCPSRDLTTTPRQRIVVRREMARQEPGSPVMRALLADYEYDAIETCAADGSCKLACPVGIDTGKLVKEFRARERGAREERVALRLAERWASVERAARTALGASDAVARRAGHAPLRAMTGAARAALSTELVPAWSEAMPQPAPAELPETRREGAAAVYLPACVNRIFGHARGEQRERSLPEALVAVSARAGLPLWIPADAAGHCCATPWSSKGFLEGNRLMARKTAAALWRWSDEGALPIVIDASSCAHGLLQDVAPHLDEAEQERYAKLAVLDAIDWAHDRLLPKLEVRERLGSVALHPTCSTRHMGLTGKLEALARALADEVVVPVAATCCGTAGDRGLLHPELPVAALRDETAELSGRAFDARLSSNRTCEIGLQHATGVPYTSFVYVLEELTRP
jgi:D-lactate dehydrogenase